MEASGLELIEKKTKENGVVVCKATDRFCPSIRYGRIGMITGDDAHHTKVLRLEA